MTTEAPDRYEDALRTVALTLESCAQLRRDDLGVALTGFIEALFLMRHSPEYTAALAALLCPTVLTNISYGDEAGHIAFPSRLIASLPMEAVS